MLIRFLTRFLVRFLTSFLARFWTRFWARGWGRENPINTVYSTTGTQKYSVQYYSDGKIYYTVLFLKKSLNFFLPPPWASKKRCGRSRRQRTLTRSCSRRWPAQRSSAWAISRCCSWPARRGRLHTQSSWMLGGLFSPLKGLIGNSLLNSPFKKGSREV